jgi:HK97 gp10 family phage protein
MAKLSARLEGLQAAKAKFKALPNFMQQKRITVNSATAQAIVVGARQRVQASPSINTRSLLNHINWTISKASGSARVGVTAGSSMGNAMPGVRKNVRIKGLLIRGRNGSALTSQGARLVRPSRYAHLIEFGTVHAKAEPFMIPATMAQKDLHLQRWRLAGRALEREMAGMSGTTPSSGGGLL